MSSMPSIARVFFGFAVEIDDVGDFHLHAVGEFVGLHTGGEVSVLGMVFCVLAVEKGQLIQGGALVGAGFEGLGLEIEKGRRPVLKLTFAEAIVGLRRN